MEIFFNYSASGRQIYLDRRSSGATFEDIMSELNTLGVGEFVKRDNVLALTKGEVDLQTALASLPDVEYRVSIATDKREFKLEEALSVLSAGYTIFESSQISSDGIFVLEDGVALSIAWSDDAPDLRGETVSQKGPGQLIIWDDETVDVVEEEGVFLWRALKSGYLFIGRDGLLRIEPAIDYRSDKMECWGILTELSIGLSEAISYFSSEEELFRARCGGETLGVDYRSLLSSPRVEEVLLWRGAVPVDGMDGVIIYCVTEKDRGRVDSTGAVDMKGFTSYHAVEEGELLAEYTYPTPPKHGYTALGEMIPAKEGADAKFKVGDNILKEEFEGGARYKSAMQGIFLLKGDSFSVSETLIIPHDVGIESGSVIFEKNIIIKGSVTSGYTVKGEKDIIIEGNLENGALIFCGGDLFVKGGIFGERSNIEIRGNCSVGFIQNSKLTVHGNLIVNSFVLQSEITSRSSIVIEGNRVKSDKRALMGGRTTVYKCLRVRSIGALGAKTEIWCGVDPVLKDKISEIKTAIKRVDGYVMALQNKLSKVQEKLQNPEWWSSLSSYEKREFQERLLKLKEIMAKRDYLSEGLEKLKATAFNSNTKELFVQIDGDITPEVFLQIGRGSYTIKSSVGAIRYYCTDRGEVKYVTSY